MTRPTTPPAAAPPTVLIVDDEVEILEALRRILRDEPYRVRTTPSPTEALALLAEGGIDLLVSDIDMPEMSGLELIAEVRRRHPDVVRVLLTGGASLESALAAINTGEVYRYLTKPWRAEALRATLREALARLDELRRVSTAERGLRRRERLLAELEASHPGILDAPQVDGAYQLQLDAVTAQLARLDAPGLRALLTPMPGDGTPAAARATLPMRKP